MEPISVSNTIKLQYLLIFLSTYAKCKKRRVNDSMWLFSVNNYIKNFTQCWPDVKNFSLQETSDWVKQDERHLHRSCLVRRCICPIQTSWEQRITDSPLQLQRDSQAAERYREGHDWCKNIMVWLKIGYKHALSPATQPLCPVRLHDMFCTNVSMVHSVWQDEKMNTSLRSW